MKTKRQARILSIFHLSAILLILLCVSTAVYAVDSYAPLQVEIPYKHIYTTTDTTADSVFHYIITAKNDAPFPAEASKNGSFSFNGVSGSGVKNGDNTTFELPGTLNFTFTRPGVYVYEINADMETDGKKINANRYTFEPNTITVTLYISNSVDDGMKLQNFTIENQQGVKLGEIRFDPVYKDPTKSVSSGSENPDKSENPVNSQNSDNLQSSYHSGKSNGSDDKETVLTGDNSYPLQYAVLTGICGLCIIVLVILRKKGRAEDV